MSNHIIFRLLSEEDRVAVENFNLVQKEEVVHQ